MSVVKVNIFLEDSIARQFDRLFANPMGKDRNEMIATVIEGQVAQARRTRFAEECAKLDISEEQSLAEEGLAEDTATWEAY